MNETSGSLVVLGHIAGPHGVRGWVKVISFTQPPEAITSYAPWRVQRNGEWQVMAPAESRQAGTRLQVRFTGIADRESAAALLNAEIAVPRAQLPASGEGGWYWADLIGLQVRNRQGVDFGRVTGLLETGAHDVLVIRGAERERLVPFVEGLYVLEVDLQEQAIRVEWDADF